MRQARLAAALQIPATANPAAFRKLILKLRWIGMEEEASALIGVAIELDGMKAPAIEPRKAE